MSYTSLFHCFSVVHLSSYLLNTDSVICTLLAILCMSILTNKVKIIFHPGFTNVLFILTPFPPEGQRTQF